MVYYIDTNNFSTATAVWSDSNLTIKAPDGFYSFSGTYRQQFDGFLLNVISCNIVSYRFTGIKGQVECVGGEIDFISEGPITLYASTPVLDIGVELYTDSELTTLTTIDGFRDGTTIYNINTGFISDITTINDPC